MSAGRAGTGYLGKLRLLVATAAAITALWAGSIGAFAYTQPPPGIPTLFANRSTSACGGIINLTATFIDTLGHPLQHLLVVFSVVQAPPDAPPRFLQTTAYTDGTGTATVQVVLPPGCEGKFYRFRATSGAGQVVSIGLPGTLVPAYPNTSAGRPVDFPLLALSGLLGAAAMAMAGFAVMLLGRQLRINLRPR